jgi:DNA polymerase III subunit delta'
VTTVNVLSGVWAELVGQQPAVEELQRAVEAAQRQVAGESGVGMTHAWLFTGPPGSGRSIAARAFAAALQCLDGGCGQCHACHTTLGGTHADVRLVGTEGLSISVALARELVPYAARHPAGGRWQILIVEDADRLTDQAANALLKALEEPPSRTVWMLCAPALEDVVVTIRSRCRHVRLRTPPVDAVAELLQRRDGVDAAMAYFAARAAQGHIGRAKRLAVDEDARIRRNDALRTPLSIGSMGDCMTLAANLMDAAATEIEQVVKDLNLKETDALGLALGKGTQGRGMVRGGAAQLKELESQQKRRATRLQRDALDRALVDLASFYRDVLALQLASSVDLVNVEMRGDIERLAAATTPEESLRRIDAVLECRQRLDANVAPLLALEAMLIALR